jgi:hypothetical protein
MPNKSIVHIIEQLATLRPGRHLCFFYQSEAEKFSVVEPFLRQGLSRGEKVVYLVNAVSSLKEIAACLCEEPAALGQWFSKGQLAVLSAEDVYLGEGGFSAERMIARWQHECEQALREGFTALRATAEMDWAVDRIGFEELLCYEARVQDSFSRLPLIGLCQYDLRRFSASCAARQLLAHPWVLACNDLVANRFYLPAEHLLDEAKQAEALQAWGHRCTDFPALLDAALEG